MDENPAKGKPLQFSATGIRYQSATLEVHVPMIEIMAESSSDGQAVLGAALGACSPTLCTMESPRPRPTITRF